MRNPLLAQVLGGVFANAMRGRANPGPFGRTGGMGGGLGGAALGSVLGGMMSRGRGVGGRGGGRGMLLAMLLPFAMQWVQRNGGIGAVLDNFRQKGYQKQAQSWVDTGDNEPIEAEAVNNIVGREELSRIAQRLGVPEGDVAEAFAEILPEMTNQLSPEGDVPPQADEALDEGRKQLEQELQQIKPEVQLS
ncbi:YidB family protein [Ramlibacter sp. PS4R-6]|uniref:YidB family protein n=1 Tax=Ramlibacter sp. PS4R-6 TaxID=3133438 RepID=UPI0030AAD648